MAEALKLVKKKHVVSHPNNTNMNKNIIAEKIVTECERRSINLCGSFDDWTKVAFSLAALGEQGRPLFHRLSRMDRKYKEQENEKKFTNALRTTDRVSFASLPYLAKQAGIDLADLKDTTDARDWRSTAAKRPTPPPPPKPLCTLPADIVARAQRWHGNLCYFLSARLSEEQAMRVLNEYHLGATKSQATIFWQIDKQGRVRTGKIMQYDPQTGHRTDRLTWVHSLMKQCGQLPQDWELSQCLFGEHLLQERPADPVALVEGEKTAVICAALWPQFLWLATGGCGNLRADTAKALTGRTVIVFPDTGSFAKWKDKVKGFSFANFNVSDILEGKGLPDNYDIADYLMQELPPAPQFTAQDLADLAHLYTD